MLYQLKLRDAFIGKILAFYAAKESPDAKKRFLRNRCLLVELLLLGLTYILFDTGASTNFASKSFAKQTGTTR
jgi:hypothetical protein